MTMKRPTSDFIDDIALSLHEDVYGANGDLNELEIHQRLIGHIHHATDYAYAESGLVPASAVATLVRAVWEYEQRRQAALMVEMATPLPEPGAPA